MCSYDPMATSPKELNWPCCLSGSVVWYGYCLSVDQEDHD